MQAAIPFPDVSPEIFTLPIFGMEFALRWYALAYIAGIVIGWRLVVATLRRPHLWKNDTPVMDERQLALDKFEEAMLLGPREDEQPELREKVETLRRELE